jgi:hypothetical protein
MNAQVALELPYYFDPRFSSFFIKLPSPLATSVARRRFDHGGAGVIMYNLRMTCTAATL